MKNKIYHENNGKIYLTSVHMGISNLFGSNFIELRELSYADKLIRCILSLFGSCYTIYLIGMPNLFSSTILFLIF